MPVPGRLRALTDPTDSSKEKTVKTRKFSFRLLDGSGTGRTVELDMNDYINSREPNSEQAVAGPRGHWPPERIEFEGRTWELVQTTGHDKHRAYAPAWMAGEPTRVVGVWRRDGEERPVTGRAFDQSQVDSLRSCFEENGAVRVEVLPLEA